MSEQEILSANALIAEFMGYELRKTIVGEEYFNVKDYQTHDGTTLQLKQNPQPYALGTISKLKFHSSWDWLIIVCKSWCDTYTEKQFMFTERNTENYITLRNKLTVSITNHYDINEAYEQLVYNIEWYNGINK